MKLPSHRISFKNHSHESIPYFIMGIFALLTSALFIYYGASSRLLMALSVLEWAALILYALIRHFGRRKYHEQLYSYLQSMTVYLDEASRENLTAFPMPITLLNSKSEVLWFNDLFFALLKDHQQDTIFGKPISMFCDNIDLEKVDSGENRRFDVTFGGKYYTVYCMKQGAHGEKDESFYVLYWMEDDTLKRDIARLKQEKVCVCYIVIDSYDEIPSNVSEIQRSNFVTRVDVKVRNLARTVGGVLKKLETDKYLLLFEQRNLNQIEKNKFSVLEEVKEISIGDTVHATLSIGVGRGTDDLRSVDRSARAALDLALSRGGDQAAVTNGDRYTFYGGKSENTEKRKRVKVRMISESFVTQVTNAENILIIGHKYADLDCIGAAIGVASLVRQLDRPVHIIYNAKENLAGDLLESFLTDPVYADLFVEVARAPKLMTEDTLLIVVDTHSQEYIENDKILKMANSILLIDHHRKLASGSIEGAAITFHESGASSTCEMVTELIDNIQGCRINKKEANALMSGIILDTKNFTERTGVRTFEAAAYLKGRGADIQELQRFFKNDISAYKKQIDIIAAADIIDGNTAISIYRGESFPQIKVIASKAADELLRLKGIHTSFVLYEQDNTVHISARSEGESNVQQLMEALGGGGHRGAAGAQLDDISLDAAKEQLLEIMKETQTEQ